MLLLGETSLHAQDGPTPKPQLREVIVSHSDDKNGILQLFRMQEDGANRRQLTYSEQGCRMPAWSPDGKRLDVKQVNHSLSLWLSDIDGNNTCSLTGDGFNLLPTWLPDSRHIVWMKLSEETKGKTQPTTASFTLWIRKRETLEDCLVTTIN